MVVTVALTLQNKLVVIPWEELDGVLRFNVFCVGFVVKLG